MKIGILTYWWSNDNYGQLLQCYALQKFLRDRGHEAFVIRYDYTSDIPTTSFPVRCLKAMNPARLLRFVLYKKHLRDVVREQKKNDRHFDDFRDQYIEWSEDTYPSYADLRGNPPEADAYIVGSDQVWNYWFASTKRFYNPAHAYFLDFGDEGTKRLAYAASWGVTELPEDFMRAVAPLLARFDYIGVREESGVDLCRLCGRDDAEWVCDPTLLLGAERYRALWRDEDARGNIRKIGNRYLILYMLNNECDFSVQSAYDFAASRNLEVVYVTGNGIIDGRDKYFATIPEWLYLVDSAEYVVTNSFHCGVFSTVFRKAFGIVPLTGKAVGMNTRFESLFELLGTGARYVSDGDFSVLDAPYETREVRVSQRFLSVLGRQEERYDR